MNDLLVLISKVRRNYSRQYEVMALCDALQERLIEEAERTARLRGWNDKAKQRRFRDGDIHADDHEYGVGD